MISITQLPFPSPPVAPQLLPLPVAAHRRPHLIFRHPPPTRPMSLPLRRQALQSFPTSWALPRNLAHRSHTGAFRDSEPHLFSKVCAILGYCHRLFFYSSPITDDEGQEVESRNTLHKRRSTTSWCNSRVPTQSATAAPVIEAQQARGAGVLRRLSLGGGFAVCHFYIG